QGTKCRLGGQPSAGPGSLCADCSRALARAREGSAAVRSGSAKAARRSRVVERIVLTSPAESQSASPPKKARAALWVTIGAVAVVVLLAATANRSPSPPVEVKVTERPARVVPQLLEPATADESLDAEPPVVPAGQVSEPPSLPKDSTRVPAPRPPRISPARAVSDAKPSADASRAAPVAAPQPVVEPPVQQARANVAPSPASVDDAQTLAAAIEKCNEEKFLAGVICEQKVRLRYCEGKWGQVPQCTKKPHVD